MTRSVRAAHPVSVPGLAANKRLEWRVAAAAAAGPTEKCGGPALDKVSQLRDVEGASAVVVERRNLGYG